MFGGELIPRLAYCDYIVSLGGGKLDRYIFQIVYGLIKDCLTA